MGEDNHHKMDIVLHTEKKSNLSTTSFLPKKYLALLLIVGVLAVVAALAASVAVVIAIRTSQELHGAGQQEPVSTTGLGIRRGSPLTQSDLIQKRQLLKMVQQYYYD